MAVTVQIPTPLRKVTGGQSKVVIEAETVAAMIDALETKFPGLKERMLDEKGELRRFVNVYVNGNDVRFVENLKTPLSAGDDVSIVPAIAGGGDTVA